MIIFICLCLCSQGDQLKGFHQIVKDIARANSDNQYLLIRRLFQDYYQDSKRPIIYYAVILSTLSTLLNCNNLDDSVRLEICHGLRRQPRLAVPLLSALEAYQNDLQARKKIIQQGIHGGTGKSSLAFVNETMSIIKLYQPKAKLQSD